jgi:hypothetical protein
MRQEQDATLADGGILCTVGGSFRRVIAIHCNLGLAACWFCSSLLSLPLQGKGGVLLDVLSACSHPPPSFAPPATSECSSHLKAAVFGPFSQKASKYGLCLGCGIG